MIQTVSILVPVYNASQWLRQCLDSIVGQTYQSLQVVLVDDGSTDDSLAICHEYAHRYPFVEVYHQANSGVAAARNTLLDKANGEFVLFVDSDDWIEPDTIEFLLSAIQQYDADMAVCGRYGNNTMAASEEVLWSRGKVIFEFLRHVVFNGSLWNKLIKISLLRGLRFDRRITYGEDALLIWQVLQRVDKVLITDKGLYHHRPNVNSISHQQWHPHKKGSGHLVWESICADVCKMWPQYNEIANARFALEDMWALYFATLAKYPYDEHIALRQQNIKRNLKSIRKAKLDSFGKYLTAWVLCRCYAAGSVIRCLNFIKNRCR